MGLTKDLDCLTGNFKPFKGPLAVNGASQFRWLCRLPNVESTQSLRTPCGRLTQKRSEDTATIGTRS
jgi:hypothetical protein